LWRFRYRHGGKEKLLALGAYPDVPLRRAREKRDEARRLVADGVDPNVQRQADKATLCHTFEIVAREWLELLKNGIKASTLERERSQLERFVFPDLGSRPIAQITTLEILTVLKSQMPTAHRLDAGRFPRESPKAGRREKWRWSLKGQSWPRSILGRADGGGGLADER
jgi:hypothetical protein